MPNSNYSQGFSDGVTIRGMPILNTYSGKVRWVRSGGGNRGTFDSPYATLEAAINASDANDTIMIKAGHTETISSATALNFDVAGLNIIGLGVNGTRPTFTLDTATTAKIPVSAANIAISNCVFVANFADIATVFLLTVAPGFTVERCEFRDTSSILNFLTVITTTVSVDANGLVFTGNKVYSLGTTAATTMIVLAGTMDRITINDNYYVGAVLNNTAALLEHGALNVTGLEMARNRVYRPNTDTATGAILIKTTATANTGVAYENYVGCLDTAGVILFTAGSDYAPFNNYVTGEVDKSGWLIPAAGTDA